MCVRYAEPSKAQDSEQGPLLPSSTNIVIELSAFPNDDFHKGSPLNSQNVAQEGGKGGREEGS